MSKHQTNIKNLLFTGVMNAKQLAEKLEISQPSLSRALSEFGDEIIKIGSAQSIQYGLRDTKRGLPDIPVYCVNDEGLIKKIGTLVPVYPEGFVMRYEDSKSVYSDSIPWWLLDMLPQGYLGRAYVIKHAAQFGLPSDLKKWNDADFLRSLLIHGNDCIGNLLLGNQPREFFLNHLQPNSVTESDYPRLAKEAANGELVGSSAGGEQPKFTAFMGRPVLVKFSDFDDNSVSERWRDLLLAEHLALETLREAGINAVKTKIIDIGTQRFLEVERFDRMGALGRRAVVSLRALDAEFAGKGNESWIAISQELAKQKIIHADALKEVELLWAFGTLMGNSDMHNGNLSFVGEKPYLLAPVYDMVPMVFAPRSGGGLPHSLPAANISAEVHDWQTPLNLAELFFAKIQQAKFSTNFSECVFALERHLDVAREKIERLAA